MWYVISEVLLWPSRNRVSFSCGIFLVGLQLILFFLFGPFHSHLSVVLFISLSFRFCYFTILPILICSHFLFVFWCLCIFFLVYKSFRLCALCDVFVASNVEACHGIDIRAVFCFFFEVIEFSIFTFSLKLNRFWKLDSALSESVRISQRYSSWFDIYI